MSKPFIVSKAKWDGLADFAMNNLSEFTDHPEYLRSEEGVWTHGTESFTADLDGFGEYQLLYNDGKGSPEGRLTAPEGAIAYIASQHDLLEGFIIIKWNNPDASGKCPMVEITYLKKDKSEQAWEKIKGYLGVSAVLALSSTGEEYTQAFISTAQGLEELGGFY